MKPEAPPSPAPPEAASLSAFAPDAALPAGSHLRATRAVRPPRSVRAALRAATDGLHHALHRADAPARIAAGTIGRADYVAFLHALLDFHAGVAPVCSSAADALGLPALTTCGIRRVLRLHDDLAALRIAPTPAPIPPPANASAAQAVGWLYTAQGSVLGAGVLYRQLGTLLPDRAGRSFFAAEPEDATAWRALCDRLEDYGTGTGRLLAMISGACDGFRFFRACLDART